MAMTEQTLFQKMATAARILSVDMIEKAGSGHPGVALGLADVLTVLWSKFLRFDATAPHWCDRDRFVLSGGHASALLYSLLYLTGYPDVMRADLESFRQLGSRTAGHPEKTLLQGVDFTTGPLGQGLIGAVGFALAERMLNARYGDDLVNHKTYVSCGDGDLMEGVSQEAIALAGHWRLNRLIVLWDDNKITIDGQTDIADDTNMKMRFEACGWQVLTCDGHDEVSITKALMKAQKADRPVLIDCRTIIGYGAPTKANTPKCHGSPLGAAEVAGLREKLNWPYAPFEVPEEVLTAWRAVGTKGNPDREAWEARVAESGQGIAFLHDITGVVPPAVGEALRALKQKMILEKQAVATRKASQTVLNAVAEVMPNLIGGSADLTAACYTNTAESVPVTRLDYSGNYINYGIREMGMAGVMNGLAAHGGFVPYGGTFLSFVDYMKPAVRLAALMNLREIFVLTHDSLGVGEDGPTHQPISQLTNLRATPNLYVFRPADSVETAECYELALNRADGPSVMALSRQALPVVRESADENRSAQGAYVLYEPAEERQATIIATGSEVALALAAKDLLAAQGVAVAVVSMPCMKLFEQTEKSYQEAMLGNVPRVIVEAGATWGWDRYVGAAGGTVIGMETFGASGKGSEVLAHFGFTPEHVAEVVMTYVRGR